MLETGSHVRNSEKFMNVTMFKKKTLEITMQFVQSKSSKANERQHLPLNSTKCITRIRVDMGLESLTEHHICNI